MLDKIFKEEGQVILGPILYKKILGHLEKDSKLQDLQSLDYIRRNFGSLENLTGNTILYWSSLLGIKFINKNRVEFTGFGEQQEASIKRFYQLSISNSHLRPNNDGSITVQGIRPILLEEERKNSDYGSATFRTDLSNIVFHFMPIPQRCENDNEDLINRTIRKTYVSYVDDITSPPPNLFKKFFKETYYKKDKENFLKKYNSTNINGIIDFYLEKHASDPEVEKLKKTIYEKIS